jgi:hypothetical protein
MSQNHLTLRLIGWIALKSFRVILPTNPPADAQGPAEAKRIDAAVCGQRQCVSVTSRHAHHLDAMESRNWIW